MKSNATETRADGALAEEYGSLKGTTYPHDLSAMLKGGAGRADGSPAGIDAFAKACADRAAELRAAHSEEGPPKLLHPLRDDANYMTDAEAAVQEEEWAPTTWESVRSMGVTANVWDHFSPEEVAEIDAEIAAAEVAEAKAEDGQAAV